MACCNACKHAQDAGEMPRGATCQPCRNPDPAPPKCAPVSFCHEPGVIVESECPTLILARVDPLVMRLWEQGQTDLEAVTMIVLETIYSATPDGRPIDWRKLSIETATCLLELRRRVRARVAYVFAHHDEDAAARRWSQARGGQ